MNLIAVASILLLASNQAAAHGLITRINGANGVQMPGLTVVDGTPRDCPSAACGGQKDTAVIRDQEMGTVKASALGRTLSSGPVDPKRVIMDFMTPQTVARTHSRQLLKARQVVNDAASVITNAGELSSTDLADKTPFGGAIKGAQSAVDDVAGPYQGMKLARLRPLVLWRGIQEYAGKGLDKGLPSVSDKGVITMIYHQVNQDGAGPLSAEIDATSVGSDPKAFKSASIIQNIPGVEGFSTSSTMDYEIKVQVPSGMKCTGVVGDIKDICIVRIRNNAISGPFGGSAAFTN